MKTKVINIVGGPGAGKSTIASGIFYLLKVHGKEVELVSEYAKELVWEKRSYTFEDSLYVTAKQFHHLYCVRDKIDYIVTDRPLILSTFYHEYWEKQLYPDSWNQAFYKLVKETWDLFDNEVYIIRRTVPYNQNGRNETKKQALELDEIFRKEMDNYGIPYLFIDGDETAPQKILEDLLKKEEQQKEDNQTLLSMLQNE